MQYLDVHFENCYGIRFLKQRFDFADSVAYAIYAPNGAMKSSFAEAFRDQSTGAPSRDRIFAARQTLRNISAETGLSLPGSHIVVVSPYDESFAGASATSTLLVNTGLRKEYEELWTDLQRSKEALIGALEEQSGSSRDVEAEIISAFGADLLSVLEEVHGAVEAQNGSPFAGVKYDLVFNDKVQVFLRSTGVSALFGDYLTRYNELL